MRLDDGREFSVAGTVEDIVADAAGFTVTYRRPRRDGTVVERHEIERGSVLWWSYGPPHAVVSDDRHVVTLPGGARTSFPATQVSSVTAFQHGFLVTTWDPNRKGLAHTTHSRRNIAYVAPDGSVLWHIGEPAHVRPASYDGVSVEPDGSLWALASEGMYMARVDPATGAVGELRPYK
ncbi:MAG TPA: hypothetical protein VGD01_05925 [Candidatus Elarobacter sp.]